MENTINTIDVKAKPKATKFKTQDKPFLTIMKEVLCDFVGINPDRKQNIVRDPQEEAWKMAEMNDLLMGNLPNGCY